MKNNKQPLCYTLIIFALLLGINHHVKSQEKINLSLGIGVPELVNLGVGYQIDPVVVGLSAGTSLMLESDEKTFSISGDIRYHFGGYSQYSYRRPWFGSIGINYFRDESSTIINKYWHLNTRIGREFNLDDKWGIYLGIGALFELSHKEIRKERQTGWGWGAIGLDWPFIPSIGTGIFFKI